MSEQWSPIASVAGNYILTIHSKLENVAHVIGYGEIWSIPKGINRQVAYVTCPNRDTQRQADAARMAAPCQ